MKIKNINWKNNVPTKGISAPKAHKALETIRLKNEGLTDDAIVNAAKPKNHVLHKWFEWDDSKAATEHRRLQARALMRSLVVTYAEAPELKTRVYEVSVLAPRNTPERTVYTTMEEVLSDSESRDKLLASAIREAMAFRRRFQMLHELDMVVEAINKTLLNLSAKV